MERRQKGLLIIGIVSATVFVALMFQPAPAVKSREIVENHKTANHIGASVINVNPLVLERSEAESNGEDFYRRNKAFIESLPKASAYVIQNFKKQPYRQLIQLNSGAEVIRITFEDGSVGYEPNLASFDISSGKFGPKPY